MRIPQKKSTWPVAGMFSTVLSLSSGDTEKDNLPRRREQTGKNTTLQQAMLILCTYQCYARGGVGGGGHGIGWGL